jgi:hypothetical protein
MACFQSTSAGAALVPLLVLWQWLEVQWGPWPPRPVAYSESAAAAATLAAAVPRQSLEVYEACKKEHVVLLTSASRCCAVLRAPSAG